jgi:BASS family bile acid:Na+ symporter
MSPINLVVQGSLLLLVFTVGLQGRFYDFLLVIRQPRLFLSGVLVVNAIVPIVAVLIVFLFPIALMTRAGLIAMAIAPMAPFLPGKMLKTGAGHEFAVGLYATLIVTAILIVPASIWAVGAFTHREVDLPVGALAWFVFTTVLLPLLAGMLVARLWPAIAPRLAKIGTIAAYVVLVPVVLFLLVKTGGELAGLLGDGTLAAIIITVLIGMVAGHALGGPEPVTRLAMSQAAVTRHPGIAGLIVQANGVDKAAMLAVILFLLVSLVLSTLYGKWILPRDAAAAARANGELQK